MRSEGEEKIKELQTKAQSKDEELKTHKELIE